MNTAKCALLLVSAGLASTPIAASAKSLAPWLAQPRLDSRHAPVIEQDGLRFRDLNRDGQVNPYENWRLEPVARAADLVARMTLAEKAGTMMHGSIPGIGNFVGFSTEGYDVSLFRPDVTERNVTSFITRLAVGPRRMAEENNKLQEIAEGARLGIPLTISTDPRHHFQFVLGASSMGVGYSQWPETLGFGALRDTKLMKRFAEVARKEYRATGIHQALSPQADLFTEPRWARGTGTFGSDPQVVRDLVAAYVEGFQGSPKGLQPDGVLTVVKHWVGYGATPEGWDGHNRYGRFAKATNKSFSAHVKAFDGAFRVNVAGVMPTYSIIQGVSVSGRPLEQVGAGFNAQLLQDKLRKEKRFDGIILSDWAITNDCKAECVSPTKPQGPESIAMPWGVENLSELERFAKGINAGIDQFGGVTDAGIIVEAVNKGLVKEALLDAAAKRVLVTKFQMGLFENPYVDPDAAAQSVGAAQANDEGFAAQAASQVLLKNDGIFPLKAGTRVWLKDVDADAARARGLVVVDKPEEADVALVRLGTPSERPHPFHFFGRRQNEGRLDFRAGDAGHDLVKDLSGKTRVALALFADRPAVLGPVDSMSSAILVNFGVSDAALLDVATGRLSARGRLPFELPSSMAAVEAQDPAVPDDSEEPLYRAGAGLMTGKN
ncbi:glycoside hydrolase family 3 protein [Rhizorhabdus sp. FW153]|uniref:glycoside hydrolase family 3 protein n=1 Tax=Rhizorhabdus sp. FW153 TaxID=3400216 RepID=UPI003CEF7A10